MSQTEDNVSTIEIEAPTKPGWYAYSGGAQIMVFLLRNKIEDFDIAPGVTEHRWVPQWSVHLNNGEVADCEWGYIEQALGVWDLVMINPSKPSWNSLFDFAHWLSDYEGFDVASVDEAVNLYLSREEVPNES